MTTTTKNISDSAGLSGASNVFPDTLRASGDLTLSDTSNVFPDTLRAAGDSGMTDEFSAALAITLIVTPIDGSGLVELELIFAEDFGFNRYTIERVNSATGSVTPVRGAHFDVIQDPTVIIYDAECPLSTPSDVGPACYYIATGFVVDEDGLIDPDFTVQHVSDSFNLHDTAGAAWIKSPGVNNGTPNANNKFLMDHMENFTYRTRVLANTTVLGRRNPIIVTDVMGGREGTMYIASYPEAETIYGYAWQRPDIMALISGGDVLFFQTTGDIGIDDFFFKVSGDVQELQLNDGTPAYPDRIWSIPFIEVDTPTDSTLNAPFGTVTWGTVAVNYASWQTVLDSHADWQELLTNG